MTGLQAGLARRWPRHAAVRRNREIAGFNRRGGSPRSCLVSRPRFVGEGRISHPALIRNHASSRHLAGWSTATQAQSGNETWAGGAPGLPREGLVRSIPHPLALGSRFNRKPVGLYPSPTASRTGEFLRKCRQAPGGNPWRELSAHPLSPRGLDDTSETRATQGCKHAGFRNRSAIRRCYQNRITPVRPAAWSPASHSLATSIRPWVFDEKLNAPGTERGRYCDASIGRDVRCQLTTVTPEIGSSI